MIVHDHAGITIRIGDASDQLREIPDETVQTVVTSPPYYGLRDYGVEGQIGLEPTLDEFIGRLVGVFAEVSRVLRPDGTMWINMGDSYVSAGSGSRDAGRWPKQTRNSGSTNVTRKTGAGLPAKSLMGVPWKLAFALQDVGWILRQDIIWAKPNPMPESVKDRCTKAHEYLFLFSKSRNYYFDAAAIAEPVAETTIQRLMQPGIADQDGSFRVPGRNGRPMRAVAPAGWAQGEGAHGTIHPDGRHQGERPTYEVQPLRNRRSVWTIAPEPTKDAHFATFPEALVRPCILAGSRAGDIVLDPFAGSGTTLHVSHRNERRAVGIELNPEYLPLMIGPLSQQVLRLEEVS